MLILLVRILVSILTPKSDIKLSKVQLEEDQEVQQEAAHQEVLEVTKLATAWIRHS